MAWIKSLVIALSLTALVAAPVLADVKEVRLAVKGAT